MALTQSSQVKMLVVVLAIIVLMSSASAAVIPQDLILKPINLGRKLLANYYNPPNAYPGIPSGSGGYPCCK
ncbi:hypothetical protein QUC31_016779 [Theobroma cacao]|nr:hypothetical protein QQP08_012432 [Theobroma cacao]